MLCPYCSSFELILNGKHRNQKQKYFCKNCKKQFIQRKYSEEFKAQALALANRLGTQKACEILEIHANTIYNWRKK
ncbi:transposase [Leptolyngbya sp. AN02str]|uniref:transposase n=1 Tax=Leptolyngbya sp. AN02str TaxID=3423363 RepID=UPI003D3208A3